MDSDITGQHGTQTIDTVVIGGGQAGLAAGYHLKRTGRPFVILDAHPRVGDAWRTRWDSLLLFTPSQGNGLPGMKYPARDGTFVTKDEFADYLETYATHFDLPVRTSTRVTRLSRNGDGFLVQTETGSYRAGNVLVAMGNEQRPRIPGFASDLDASILQLHSSAYRNADQLPSGHVLIVGVGNSGADIAMDVVRSRPTTVAGNPPGVVPFRIETWIARHVLLRIVRFVGHRVLNVRNPIGRKVAPKFVNGGAPLIRHKPKDLVAAGIERVDRIVGVHAGQPVTSDGVVVPADVVIWATGYRPNFPWIDLPILEARGLPRHVRGEVPSVPGLFFLGLELQTSVTSATIGGMRRDAKRMVSLLDRRPWTEASRTSKLRVSA